MPAGFVVGDAIMGRYLSPRIGNVDVKMLLMFKICILGHFALSAVTAIEAYQREKMNAVIILLALYTLVVALVFSCFQVCCGMLSLIFIMPLHFCNL